MVTAVVFEERFEALRRAGAGAMGTVFRARDRVGGGWVAVKILREEDAHDVERFAREGDILAGLSHPGIVRHVAHGVTAAGEHYLAMEWLDGEDLAARLLRRGLTAAETLTLARRALDALAFAHARGLVHRDLKPSNLFLVGGDVARVKIVDFGIARLGRENGKRLTSTGALLGTPGYIAPEQILGAPAHDPRADLFSLGCVLFECLAGRPAFEGTTVMAMLAKILLQEVPRLRILRPSIPEPIDDLVARMMARDPAARPSDAAAVLTELDRLESLDLVRGLGAPTATVSTPPAALPSLTLSEQRLVTLVLAGDPSVDDDTARRRRPSLAAIKAAVEPHGGRAMALAGGSLLVTQWGEGSAVDRAERAARCALAIKERFGGLPVCVISGRGEVSAQVVDGDLIERAVLSLGAGRTTGAYVDEATAELIGGRIRVDRQGPGGFIQPERAAFDGVPLLLGRTMPCIGRARELAMLEGIFNGCVSEPAASAILVVGDAGMGKTRLRHELLTSLRRRSERVEVLIGSCEGLGAGSAFAIIADLVRRAAGILDGEPLAARQAKLRARVARHLDRAVAARASAFLGELAGTPFPDGGDGAIRAARESARLMGDGMRAAWEEWLAAECAAQPVLVILDNLQWSDAASMRLVDSTLRNLRDLPLMFFALARPEIHDRFPDLWAERDVQLIRLGPLPRRASEQLVCTALGAEADAKVVARVLDRADGNPFYLEELVRAVAAGREATLPDSVLGTVEARLDAEGPEAKRVLRAASVFGRRFTRGGILAMVPGRSEAEVAASLDALAAREIVIPVSASDPTGDAVYVFAHALVREAAYATLTGPDRALGHMLAGEWLERNAHADAMTLAEHFRRGADPARAARWFRRAAELALEADDLTVAVERAAFGVDCGAEGEELGYLRLIQAEAHLWRGALAEAEASAAGATALLPIGTAAWFRAVGFSVVAAGRLAGYDRVEDRMSLVARTAPARGAASAQLVCLCECATVLVMAGRYAAADGMIDRLRKVAPDPSMLEAPVAAALEQLAAIRACLAGDPGESLARFEASLASLESAGDRRNACAVRSNLGCNFAQLGDFDSAEDALRAALAAAERMGLVDVASAAAQNLGRTLAHLGRLEEAEQLELRAADAFRRLGDPRHEGAARSYLAEIALSAADPARAEREAAAATDLLRTTPPLRAPALALHARAVLRQGRAAEALVLAREALAIVDELGSIEDGEALVRLVHVEALAASGDREAFSRAATLARRRLLARAARIGDPAWRERFLTAVPENAQTLVLTGGSLSSADLRS
ncbi:Adenylate cyclase [Minicystis rosea]|nr:Adenylate cyclase [Minicystis rosea]